MKTKIILPVLMTIVLLFGLPACDQDDQLVKKEKEVVRSADQHSARGDYKLDESSEEIKVQIPITKEMEDAVVEVVKPVTEIVEKLLNEDPTGTFSAYKKDIEELGGIKDEKERRYKIAEMYQHYLPFFEDIWKRADIDDAAYQEKIKNIFPKEIQETIKFSKFLNFTTHIKKPMRDAEPSPAPPPPAPPKPEDICHDATTTFFPIVRKEHYGNANASAFATDRFLSASTGCAVAGYSNAMAALASNITIPGTFPDDDRLLRVRKDFTWTAHATAFSVIGCSFASTQYSTVQMEEFFRAWAPVTFIMTKEFNEVKSEEYLIRKQFLYNIRYGISVYTDSYGAIAAGGVGSSFCSGVIWTACEEDAPANE